VSSMLLLLIPLVYFIILGISIKNGTSKTQLPSLIIFALGLIITLFSRGKGFELAPITTTGIAIMLIAIIVSFVTLFVKRQRAQ
jgi:hypothetical protein